MNQNLNAVQFLGNSLSKAHVKVLQAFYDDFTLLWLKVIGKCKINGVNGLSIILDYQLYCITSVR